MKYKEMVEAYSTGEELHAGMSNANRRVKSNLLAMMTFLNMKSVFEFRKC